ncbi:IclR family transcriptional regulator [Streptomyces sp. bgisy027]|uniref:IclR family transcriptional regulator n=1 Tax=unclassified Streptomyces TaxID=2593676 RepID=UPI003D732896
MRTQNGESVLARAARIFEAFTPEEPALTVSQIARRTGLHVATASRLIAELVTHEFLARDSDRRVRIGLRMWELVTRASPAVSLRDAAMPFMEGVHDVVGHHVQLGVLDGDEVLFLERLSSPGAVINYTRVACRLPLHASSSGLVLLAHGPADVRARVLAEPLRRYTDATPATAPALRTLLAGIRQQGYAYCPGYVHADALGVAAPVRDEHGDVLASLSVIVPNEPSARQVVPVVRTAVHGVSRALRSRGQARPPAFPLTH